jgi:nitrous oxidase accessory protein NosD
LSNLTDSGPLVISGQSNVTISGMRISNPNGHCIEINGGSKNITIVGSQIGPCGKDGVYVNSSSNVTVQGNIFTNTGTQQLHGSGNAVEFEQSDGLVVRSNRMDTVATGVYTPVSTHIVIEYNSVKNIQGPMPRGQMVQFNQVNGGGNAVRCNVLENVPGQSGAVEDHISMYASNGLAGDPIVIENNRTKGGESTQSSGCGIVIGDVSGGNHFRVTGNVFVNTGNCGIGLTAGSDVQITSNIVVSRGQTQANVGLLAWNLYGKGCSGNTFANNRVYWDSTIRSGTIDNWWDGSPDKSCQPLIGWNTNVVDSTLTAAVFDQPIAACN